MSKKLQDAMPIGSRWSAYHHALERHMGERTVRAHRSRDMVFVNHAKDDTDAFLTYPKADRLVIDGDKVVVLDETPSRAGLALLTYTRVTEGF